MKNTYPLKAQKTFVSSRSFCRADPSATSLIHDSHCLPAHVLPPLQHHTHVHPPTSTISANVPTKSIFIPLYPIHPFYVPYNIIVWYCGSIVYFSPPPSPHVNIYTRVYGWYKSSYTPVRGLWSFHNLSEPSKIMFVSFIVNYFHRTRDEIQWFRLWSENVMDRSRLVFLEQLVWYLSVSMDLLDIQ